jgi:LAO/AO transport system kinase
MARATPEQLVAEVLEGRVQGIARLISKAEAGDAGGQEALAAVFRHTGRAHIVGVTGVPGSGKSTLVAALTRELRASGKTVGIIAVDPTSPFSGGAILGDRIRMAEVAQDPGVFIRSMATRGALGGLARASLDAADVLDAAGFDIVLIETVGVGQDEVDIARAAQTVVVVSAPGLGDDIQAIKAGILEIADIHVVSKCDRSDANDTVRALRGMLKLEVTLSGASQWAPPVIRTSIPEDLGIDKLRAAIAKHRRHLESSGGMDARRRRIMEMRVLKTAEDLIRSRFESRRDGAVSELLERVLTRELNPYGAARELLAALKEEGTHEAA